MHVAVKKYKWPIMREFIPQYDHTEESKVHFETIDGKHDFNMPFGNGMLGATPVTYFVPGNDDELQELSTWLQDSNNELSRTLQIYEFREIKDCEYPVLITERLTTTLLCHIWDTFARKKSSHESGMALITLINDLFNAYTRASAREEAQYTCKLQNMFVGPDGVIKMPFVRVTDSDNQSVDGELRKIFNQILKHSYADPSGNIANPDLLLLQKELFKPSGSDTKLLNMFKSTKFPLSTYEGIQTFLLSNTDYVKDVSQHDFGVEMEKLLRGSGFVPWEHKILSDKLNESDMAEVVEIHNQRRHIPNPGAVPIDSFSKGNNSDPKGNNSDPKPQQYINCPMQYVHLSRNLRAHQHTNRKGKAYPPAIQQLSTNALFRKLCKIYPGVYTAFYITLCRLESNNAKFPQWE